MGTEKACCPHCNLTDISFERTCHNSDCASYATPETVYEGWNKRAAQPAMDREAVENQEAISDAVHAELWKADASVQHLAQTLRFLLHTARDYLADAPVGNPVHFAIEQADRALSTLSADAIRQGEGEAEGVVADHQFKPHVCECGERFCTGSELTWHQVQHHDLAPTATPASHASDGGKANV